ncbi:MAG: hypothetical protein HOQ05_14300 [Corynebacteriales bacterium]|nr:hypothetical protein [Mycobacteriales bacterium]
MKHNSGYDDLTPEPSQPLPNLADAEVISVKIDAPGEKKKPCAGLEESLDQIERLAAELADLAAPEPSTDAKVESAVPDVEQDKAPDPSHAAPPRPSPRRPRPNVDSRKSTKNTTSEASTAKPEPAAEKKLQNNGPIKTFHSPREHEPMPPSWGATTPTAEAARPQPTRVAAKEAPNPTREMPRVAHTGPHSPTKNTGPAPRKNSRRWVFGLLAAALAIPAFALGAVQPWLSEGSGEEQVTLGASDRDIDIVDSGPQDPTGAIPNKKSSKNDTPTPDPESQSSPSASQSAGEETPSSTPTASLRRGTPAPLYVKVTANEANPRAGVAVTFTLRWTDGTGHYAGLSSSWDDGSPVNNSQGAGCSGGKDAFDTSGSHNLTHTYSKAGTYTADFTVTTETCDGKTERRTVSLTIEVAAAPTPTPSPTPKPSDSTPSS